MRPAVLAMVASSTSVFIATPFLLQPVAAEFDASLGSAGWISTAQLAGFVGASWLAGRLLRPSRRVFIAIATLGVIANLSSAVAPHLPALAATRVASGVSLGLAAWFAWQEAFGDAAKTGDVAVTGPLVGVVLAPTITAVLDAFDIGAVFVMLAMFAALPLAFARQVDPNPPPRPARTRNAATRAAQATLVALGLVTLAGSSVFVYAAAIGTEFNGLSPFAVSLLFSGNAIVGIPAAKWSGRRGPAGMWFALIAVIAVILPSVHVTAVFCVALVGWGFVFFMAIPASFSLLASRSRYPEERAGDAQAIMALGRVFGPLVGGAFIATGATTKMGLAAGAIMLCAAGILLYVERDRFAHH